MSRPEQGTGTRSEEALEQLLSHASPRPMPSESDEAAVREAVRAEWQSVSGRRQSRRRVAAFAIAAGLCLAVFASLSLLRLPVADAVQVATIEKSFGSIYLLGETSELRETKASSNVLAGQTIVTGEEAGMALAWSKGGSLRMDANTRIRFLDEGSVFLASGRLYFDSTPSTLLTGISSGGAPEFMVITNHGKVTHVGTQFMTRVGDRDLIVSVREGQVSIDSNYQQYLASPGEQVTISGRGQPTILSIGRSGGHWDWVSRTSPVVAVDGRSLHEFLLWASRETGLELRYEGGAEQIAYEAKLRGAIDTPPLDAVRLRLETAALGLRIADGIIYVSED